MPVASLGKICLKLQAKVRQYGIGNPWISKVQIAQTVDGPPVVQSNKEKNSSGCQEEDCTQQVAVPSREVFEDRKREKMPISGTGTGLQ